MRIRRDDAPLIRRVAAALMDPAQEEEARRALREHFGESPAGFKEFLRSAPLEDVDLTRERDLGREIEL